jgi:hypothetical protein
MNKLDSTTFDAAVNEQVTFSLGTTNQLSGAAASVDGGPGTPLPVTVTGDHLVTVNVGFTGQSGGFADVTIVGSLGGSDTDRIAQFPGMPFRERTYRT